MTQLKWWLRIVGGFLLFLALLSLLLFRANAFVNEFPDLLNKPAMLAFGLLSDTRVMFGLELGMIGLMLIVAARAPWQALKLVYPIIILEIVRSILDDISMNSMGFYSAFISIHLLLLVTGLAFLKQRLAPSEPIGTV